MMRSDPPRASRIVAAGAAFAAALALNCTGLSAARANSAPLVGSWSGSGSIAFASGAKERARCRAYYAKTGETSYRMSATCATASAKVDQTAMLTRTGARTYCRKLFQSAVQYRRLDPHHGFWRQPERALVRRGRNGVVHLEEALDFIKRYDHLARGFVGTAPRQMQFD